MARQHALREVDPETGDKALALRDPEKAAQEVAAQTNLTLRTADLLRRMQLVEMPGRPATRLEQFPAGKADPICQLVLMARDEWQAAEDPKVKLGYFRLMKDLFCEAEEKVQRGMDAITDALGKDADRRQRDRHHKDKMALEREKRETPPTDGELRQIAGYADAT